MTFEERLDHALARWVAAVDRRPARVVAALLVLSALLGVYAATRLKVNSDPYSLISADLPFRVLELDFLATFRPAHDEILILIEGETASTAARAADALAERLEVRRDLFDRAVVVGGGEFFRRHALLYLSPEDLDEFVDRLAVVQPFLAEIGRDPSLVGLSTLLATAVDAAHDGVDVGLDLAGALDRVSLAAEAATAGRPAPDPWGDALIGGSLSEEARFRVVALMPNRDLEKLLFAAPAVAAIDQAIADLSLDADHGLRVRVTGQTVLNYEELRIVDREGKVVAVASFVLFSVAVFFGLRSLRVILALVLTLLASILWTNAFAAAAVGHLNQVSAVFNVLIVGLGGELGIHFCMRYLELLGAGRSRPQALAETAGTIGSSLASSAGTTAIGFLVFLPTDYRGVAELGLISGAGVLLSLVATLTLLPALLSLGAPTHPRVRPPALPWASRLRHLPVRWARPIRFVALAAVLASLALVPRARFDYDPIHLRDPDAESVRAFRDLLARSQTTPWAVDVIMPDLAAADALAQQLAELPPVERAITASDFVPDDQDEKLAGLAQAALFLPPVSSAPARPSPDQERAALARLRESLAAEGAAPSPELSDSERRLRRALSDVEHALAEHGDPDALLARLRDNVLGSLPEQLEELKDALRAGHVALADLPSDMRDQFLAADGRARIQIFPRRNVADPDAMAEFLGALEPHVPNMTGPAVTMVEWGRVTSSAMREALAIGLVCMAAFLLVLWRSVWDTLLAFFPLALAAVSTVATMVVLQTPFNFANVIVLPMLLGMGIDNGVHLVHRHRTNPEEVDVLATSTARAVFYAALTTVLAFGSLGFASHQGMAAIGRMLTLGVALTLVCYMVVLPAVLEWDDARRRRRQPRP